MIEAKIICDSVSHLGNRLTSFILKYPRMVHSEFLTHRAFSRNASSNRAIPVSKLIEEAEFAPALPIFWGKNQKGMQAMEELDSIDRELAIKCWSQSRLEAVRYAKLLNGFNLHKQLVNRILEPYTHITVICTATEYGNFFNLRAEKSAQPEIQELAFQMLAAYQVSVPAFLNPGEWHLPFADKLLDVSLTLQQKLEICTARAARVSYMTFDNVISYEKDKELHDNLIINGHASPLEHSAQALDNSEFCGNFRGWKQYRKFISNENRTSFDAKQILKNRNLAHVK